MKTIDPKFKHAACDVLRAGDTALTLQFAWIAQIDQDAVFIVEKRCGVFGRNAFDLGARFIEQLAVSLFQDLTFQVHSHSGAD